MCAHNYHKAVTATEREWDNLDFDDQGEAVLELLDIGCSDTGPFLHLGPLLEREYGEDGGLRAKVDELLHDGYTLREVLDVMVTFPSGVQR
jgi:hypothetical protein